MDTLDDRKEEALGIIDCQLEALQNLPDPWSETVPLWKSRTIRFLQDRIRQEEIAAFDDISRSSWREHILAYRLFLGVLRQGLSKLPAQYLAPPRQEPRSTAVPDDATHDRIKPGDATVINVFVIHGHNDVLKLDVARTLEKLKLNAVVLHEQPSQGRTIIEKFERHAASAAFAVAILSADDVGYAKAKVDDAKARARQNVVLELGYFAGLLGRRNVAVLYEGGVEIPSDYLGVVYIPIDDAGSWKFTLAKEIKAASLPVDLNALL